VNLLTRPPLTPEQINANRAKVGMPPLEQPDSRALGRAEARDANERLDHLRDLARLDPEAQYLMHARLVDRDWENRLRVVSDHKGRAWEVWWMVASDVMDYFGLHGPFLDPEQTPDLYSAYNQSESVIQARGGNTHFKHLTRMGRR